MINGALVGSYSQGYIVQSTTPERYTLEIPFTPPTKGQYEIDIYNSRTGAQMDVYNFIDNVQAAPADPDFKALQVGISGSVGGSIDFEVDVGAQHQGEPYLMVFAEGIQNGFMLDGFEIALNYDNIFQYSKDHINMPPFQNTFGNVDSLGVATGHLTLGANPANIGRVFFAQASLLTPPGTRPVTHVTNPILFEIIP